MNRNTLYLLVAALAVAAGVLGYQLYKERHSDTVEISIGKGGLSIEKK